MHASAKRHIEQRERQLPLAFEVDLPRDACCSEAASVRRPLRGEVQAHPTAAAALLARHMLAHRHLAVVRAAQRPGVLASDTDGMRALWGDASPCAPFP